MTSHTLTTRYALERRTCGCSLHATPQGPFVRYEDHTALLTEAMERGWQEGQRRTVAALYWQAGECREAFMSAKFEERREFGLYHTYMHALGVARMMERALPAEVGT
jgi:hypothetical protein